MDFSRFVNTLNEQKAAFENVEKNMDAKGFDDICNKLNSTLSDIALVASVVPIESKKELITILKSIREIAVGLQELRRKFDGPEETVTQETTNEIPAEPAPMEPIEPAPIESTPIATTPRETTPVEPPQVASNNDENPFTPEGPTQSQSEGQELSKGNVKTLTLTNPFVPNGNVYTQFNNAA